MNWNAAPEDVEPRYGRVTLEQQARYLPLAYERVQRGLALDRRGEHLVSQARHRPVGENRQPEAYFRLLAPDFTPQPVYESMQAYTAGLR
jgi:hypothetical protein